MTLFCHARFILSILMARLRNLSDQSLSRFIWIFYAIGLLGLGVPWTRDLFISMFPLSFLVAFIVLFITDRSEQRILIPLGIIIFLFGFLISAVSVNTGVIFGDLEFGKALGPKISGTPYIIGWHWLMIVYCSIITVRKYTKDRYFISFLAAVLMVVFDMVLEGAAGNLDMWIWTSGNVPIQNFLVWFGFSWFLTGVVQIVKVDLKNSIAPTLFAVHFFFFFLLNLLFYIEKAIL